MEKAECMFVGFDDQYLDVVDDRMSYTIDTDIHHVERWGTVIKNHSWGQYISWRKDETQEEYLMRSLENGTTIHEYCSKWIYDRTYGILGVNGEDVDYLIKSQNDNLPFDYSGRGKIDLIVAKKTKGDTVAKRDDESMSTSEPASKKTKKIQPRTVTPLDVLQDFDLTICAASFDGRTFRIPNPHLTFAGKTTMEPLRKAVVESYVRFYDSKNPDNIRATIPSVEMDLIQKGLVGCQPFFRFVDRASFLLANKNDDDSYSDDEFDYMITPRLMMTDGAYKQFHNWTRKLIKRLRKYQNRGIEVVGAPVIDPDLKLMEYTYSSPG